MFKQSKWLVVSVVALVLVVALILLVNRDSTPKGEVEKAKPSEIHLDALYVAGLPTSREPVPDFSAYKDVVAKKKAFFAYLLPEIRRQNFIVLKERKMVLALYEMASNQQPFNTEQQQVFEYLLKKYQLMNKQKHSNEYLLSHLLKRVDVIPEALILVQAANESGWGTSRFAVDGYNFFGLWCFKKGCGFVPSRRNEDSNHEVAKFRDLSHAVMTYVRNLNRLYAYEELRTIRINLRRKGKKIVAEELVKGLSRYSERGQAYIDELLAMLRVNKKYMRVVDK
jgi:Bax protein